MYIRKFSGRFVCLFLAIFCALILFSAKLVWIQIFRSSHLANLAKKQHNHSVKIEPLRGVIFDRNLRPLAMNVPVYSLYANPRQMISEAKEKAIEALPEVLGISRDHVIERLSRDKLFVWIIRKVSVDIADQVRALDIKGLGLLKETKRYYPNKELAAHVLGFAGMDNRGLEGLELQYDQILKGENGWAYILRDAKQRSLLLDQEFVPPKDGDNLILTIDETIQFMVEEALDKAFEKHNAKWASVVVMDPQTGEILAMANRPTYNLNDFGSSSPESRTNRSIAFMYEPGSVFKIVTATAAIEEDAFHEDDVIFCENGEYRIGKRILHDHHGYGNLKFRQVIEQSSNIGTVKVAQKLGEEIVHLYAQRFGFGQKTGIDLRGEVAGVLKPTSRWSKTTITALPMGHEVGVTPLQLACAVSAIANGGRYMKPFVVKYITDKYDELIREFEPYEIDRVMSQSTADRVSDILKGVVDNGTGKRAQIKGVSVAGKTGTAQKVVGGVYSHNKYEATFIGFAPVEDPKIAAVVMFDEPHPQHYGGTVAAPVFREIVEGALPYLEAKDVNL